MKNEKALIYPVQRLRRNVVQRLTTDKDEIPVFEVPQRYAPDRGFVDYLLKEKVINIPEDYKWLSDFFMTEYLKWQKGSYIFISCGTGTGKTTMIENLARLKRYSILVLTNRKANLLQIKKHLEDKNVDFIEVISYQQLEIDRMYDVDYLNLFDYICCDESHYFSKDGEFQSMVNVSLWKILNTTTPIKILMSATNDIAKEIFIKRLKKKYKDDITVLNLVWEYKMRKSALRLNSITCFNSFDEITEVIKKSNYQWLIFVKSIIKGREIESRLKELKVNAIFLDRDSCDKGTKAQKETFKYLIDEESFRQQVLISTRLLDNGVNIFSENLKAMVIYESDQTEIIQMLGRKRSMNNEDYCDLYLINESNQSLASSIMNGVKKKTKYNSTRFDIYNNRLSDIHYLNSDEGYEYRIMSYYNPLTNGYYFNQLGYDQISLEIQNYRNLQMAKSPFDLKLSWILDTLYQEEEIIVNDLKAVNRDKFMSNIEPILNITFNYQTKKEKKEFHVLFCKLFWTVFNKQKGERNDRPLNIQAINQKIIEHELPIIIEVLNEKVTIKKILIEEANYHGGLDDAN